MAAANVVSTLDGLFKRIYADAVINLIPDNVPLYNMVPFEEGEKLGDSFRQPVIVKQEQGYTYGGSAGNAFNLNASIAGQVADANIKGYESVLRTQISYGVASRSASSEAAFERGTKLIVANMLRSFAKRLEISLMHGQKEIGLVNAATTASNDLVISDASWAPGIWNAVEGATVEIFSANLGTDRTGGARTINAVNMETQTVTVSGGALTLTAGDRVEFGGAYDFSGTAWNEMRGLVSIMKAFTDGSTDLFGINPASYNVWRSTTYDVGAADLSFQKLQIGIGQAAGRGLDEDVVCMVSMRTWAKLLSDQAALRHYDSSYSTATAENGSEVIRFYGQTGKVEIMPSAFCKQGEALVFPKAQLMRIGSTDVTFKLPGADNDRFFRELVDQAGFEIRAYSDQALFCPKPNSLLILTNIVNS